ncbi:hypothetical protein AcW1_008488 [Taiwanofungus camphoratus]|nr:hypothetical protein AcV5_008778 [Antrodia cinnamomea]KAI0951445.1 hypothetical protein AcW1_008488 [Antrodia cinnamomea]KAI0956346.1 hypothetical protein AcV7_006774 [Antrodia cinnamomea]
MVKQRWIPSILACPAHDVPKTRRPPSLPRIMFALVHTVSQGCTQCAHSPLRFVPPLDRPPESSALSVRPVKPARHESATDMRVCASRRGQATFDHTRAPVSFGTRWCQGKAGNRSPNEWNLYKGLCVIKPAICRRCVP